MGQLSQLVSLISDRLQADTEFANVTVLTERKGDIENEIGRALATLTDQGGKAGACAIVMAPLANVSNPNLPGPYLEQVNILVHIEEAVTVNTSATGTGKPASDLAERALALLHRWTPDGFPRPLIADRAAIVAREPAAGDLAYGVRLTWAVGVSVSLATVATPTFSATNGGVAPCTVTIACATTGAATFYTLDNSRPTPSNGTLYTAPVAVAAPCTVKAIAWFPGKLSSVLATLTTT